MNDEKVTCCRGVVDDFRASGEGWQARMDSIPKGWIEKHRKEWWRK